MISKCGILSTFLLILLPILIDNINAQKYMNLEYNWKYLEFQFPDQYTRDRAIQTGQYIRGNSFPIDVDVYYGASVTKKFVTIPRVFSGTPITLGTITGYNAAGGPLIEAFPNYNWQNTGNCNGFTSVYRIAVDECQRLWVLDSGVINDVPVCQPQLVVFDLRVSGTSAQFIHKFPTNLYRNSSLFITPIVDIRNNNCADTMVYIADVTGFGIIVYDYRTNRSWRTESQSDHLRPNTQYSNFVIAGEGFNLPDGVFGMAVSPKNYNNRQLFFHSLASIMESRIPLSLLDNPANWQYTFMNPNPFVQFGVREYSQSTAQAMDRNGNLFFATIKPLGIACWDSTTPYTANNLKLVVQDNLTLQFVSGLKIVTRNNVQELWVLSCKFQKIMGGTRNMNEINYIIQSLPINTLLSGSSRCNGAPFPRLY